MTENAAINQRLQRITHRAERSEVGTLAGTFVAVGGVENVLFNPENQILFGRRGTGKTHALRYLEDQATRRGEAAVYVDLRTIGSNSSIYSDRNRPESERITTLVVDVCGAIREGIIDLVTGPNTPFDLSRVAPKLDALADAISKVYVDTEFGEQAATATKTTASNRNEGTAELGSEPKVGITSNRERSSEQNAEKKSQSKGERKYTVHFGTIANCFSDIASSLGRRLWVLLDEWSAVPEDLQPYLADVIRRSIFPLSNVTVLIAAIEFRSVFQISVGANYTGIEVGADCSANINFDDFIVFENNPQRSKNFFERMIFQHFQATDPTGVEDVKISSSQEMINATFTQRRAFDELVKAAEGVPRDAINILALAASRAEDKKISLPHIHAAAGQWFDQDKSQVFKRNRDTELLLAWIVDSVIGQKRSRAFLLDLRTPHRLIEELLDARLIHVLKRSISGHDEPGVRYRAYKIDYGCYVQLLKTARSPLGLFQSDDEKYIDVPPDDYRAIRRSILDMNEFNVEKIRTLLPKGSAWTLSISQLLSGSRLFRLYDENRREDPQSIREP
jgi:hypothetical protein